MSSSVWVKVVGFNGVERHAFNTLFRLSMRQTPAYCLWTPDAPAPPHVTLIDMDSHEADVELASPSFNPNLKIICVGDNTHEKAWRSFQRPVDWGAMVQVLDGLFLSPSGVGVVTGYDTLDEQSVPPGVRSTLLVGLSQEQCMYLRARLSLAGLADVDEADNGEEVDLCIARRHYDVVIISLELLDTDPWEMVQMFIGMQVRPRAVIVTTDKPSWPVMERAEQSGCVGLLDIPFDPPQVLGLLQRV